MLSSRNLPNFITALRLVGTCCLLFIEPFSALFYLVYTLSGISDVLDGWVARKMKTTSEFGSRMDSIADLLFYAVMFLKIFPVLWKKLPLKIWVLVGGVLILRIITYLFAAVKFHRFASLHTYLNKLTGAAVFATPYMINLPIAVPFCWGVGVIALLAGLYELGLHVHRKEYKVIEY